MKKIKSLSILLGLGLFLFSQLAPRALAAEPIIQFVPVISDVTFHHLCSFPILLHTKGTAIFHVYFDNAGHFLRVIITSPDTTLTFTNLSNGKSVWTPSVNMVEEYGNPDGTGTQTLRGLLDRIVVPGQGLVAADVGRLDLVFTLDSFGNPIGNPQVTFISGIQDGIIPNPSILCSVLQ